MISDNSAVVGSFYDFGGLRQLRADATTDSDGSAAKKVASEFEAAFIQLMLQSMKKASEPLKSDLFSDDSMDYFEDMFLNEMSHFIASRQSLGLATWIDESLNVRQLK